MDDVNSLNTLVSLQDSKAIGALKTLVPVLRQLEAQGWLKHTTAAMLGAVSVANVVGFGVYLTENLCQDDFSPCHMQFACAVHAICCGDIVLEPGTATAQYNADTHLQLTALLICWWWYFCGAMTLQDRYMCQWPSPRVSQTTAASQADLVPLCNQASWSVAPENSLHDSIEMHIQVGDRPVQGSHLQNIVLFH